MNMISDGPEGVGGQRDELDHVPGLDREARAQHRARRLADVSRKVREESMRVNAEFAAIERDPDAE